MLSPLQMTKMAISFLRIEPKRLRNPLLTFVAPFMAHKSDASCLLRNEIAILVICSGDSIRYDRLARHDQGYECFALVDDATIGNTLVPKEGEAFAQTCIPNGFFRCKCYRPYK